MLAEELGDGEKTIACINPKGKNMEEVRDDYQGYIMAVKGEEMPDNLVATLENGDKVSPYENRIDDEKNQGHKNKIHCTNCALFV